MRAARKKKKKKETHETPLFSLPRCIPYHASLLRSISISFLFFFQPATDLHPPLPLPPPNNNNSFLCNNNVPPYSVEARRNVPDVSVELELIWLGESSERVAQMRSRM